MKYVRYDQVRKMIIESNINGRDYREMMDGLDELPTVYIEMEEDDERMERTTVSIKG